MGLITGTLGLSSGAVFESSGNMRVYGDILINSSGTLRVKAGGTISSSGTVSISTGAELQVNYIARIKTGAVLVDDDGKYDDLRFPVTGLKEGAGVRAPAFSKIFGTSGGSDGVFTHHFDSDQQQELFLACQMPHDMKLGTALHPHLHYVFPSTKSGNVRWGLEYCIKPIDGTYTFTQISYITSTHEVKNKHVYKDITDISTTGITTPSALLLARVFRDATSTLDTFTTSIALLEIDFHYQRSKLGTVTETGT